MVVYPCTTVYVARMPDLKRAVVLGASGYTGAELLRLLAAHPGIEVGLLAADTLAGQAVAGVYPGLSAAYAGRAFDAMPIDPAGQIDRELFGDADVVFLGLPHDVSVAVVPRLIESTELVVDLSAAYRLRDLDAYPKFYGFRHSAPEFVERAVYGLPEKYRLDLIDADLIATPGCYVTAATLALEPLAPLIGESGAIVDAASGVSGAGRSATTANLFVSIDEDMSAYGLLDHRHTPEMEQEIGVPILFTPHLVPMARGILATCYFTPDDDTGAVDTADLLGRLAARYANEPYVVVSEALPHTKATLGSNLVMLTARRDQRTGRAMVIAALDNLTKGAAGGALQSANLALGFEETLGLSSIGVTP